MAEITIKRTGQLARKVFEILMKHPEGLPARKVIETVESELPLTDFEKSFYPNRPHVRRFEKIVRFSTIGPVKAGWLVKNKGIWSVTDEGRQAFESFSDPAAFMEECVLFIPDPEAFLAFSHPWPTSLTGGYLNDKKEIGLPKTSHQIQKIKQLKPGEANLGSTAFSLGFIGGEKNGTTE